MTCIIIIFDDTIQTDTSQELIWSKLEKGAKMENLDIRLLVSESGLRYKDIAKTMEICPEYLSRMMKKPLSLRNKARILDAIEKLRGGHGDI